jgi:homoserine kinase
VANVAVGYDVLGFAIEKPGDEIIIRKKGNKPLHFHSLHGVGKKVPRNILRNTAGLAAFRVLEALGEKDMPLEMELHKNMRFGTGLGSSAASAVAGAMAVNELLGRPFEKKDLLPFAVEGEQLADGAWHADNVAPSLLGGMVLIRDNKTLDFKKIHVPKGLYVSIIYPHVQVLTSDSRAVVSEIVSLKQLINQTGNMGAFIAAMFTSDYELIRRSLKDHVVEPQRKHLIPYYEELKEIALASDALGFNISGAGPTMFALCANNLIAENICEKSKAFLTEKHLKSDVFVSKINMEGAYRF